MATAGCVVNVLDLLVRSKPGAQLGKTNEDAEAVVQAWHMVLEPLSDEDVMGAAMRLARSGGDFLPSAGAVFQAVLDERDPEPDAGAAWALVERKARGGKVSLPYRAKTTLSSMGGCAGWPDDMTFKRKDFEKLYEAEGKKWRRGVSSGRLALPEPDERRLTDGSV